MSEIAYRYLHEAAASGSMRAAGDRIGVAVSSISRQIAQLETELGLPLIERGRRAIRLTEAGSLAVEHYRSQLAERDVFLNRLSDLRGVRSGAIDLALGEGFLGEALTDVLLGFQRRNPMIKLSLHTAATSEIVRRVTNDESHIGLVFHAMSEPSIRIRASAAQPLMVLVAPGHPLAGRERMSLSELGDTPLCLAPREFRIRQTLAAAEARQHLFLEPLMTTNSILVMRAAALSGQFATILPPVAALAELRSGALIGLELIDQGLEETTVVLVTRTGRQLEGAPLRMLNALEHELRSWNLKNSTRLRNVSAA